MAQHNSYVLYDGPSAYDGAPIVVIATGFAKASKNSKTGAMLQTFIMPADIAPHTAQATGDDASVCGACPLRPLSVKMAKLEGEARPQCYVTTIHAPLSTWRAYQRGNVPTLTYSEARSAIIATGQPLRMGSYGDPAAVPFEVWEAIGVGSGEFGHTGYTHGWLLPDVFDKRILGIAMASVDPISAWQEHDLLRPLNARTFRVLGPESTANGQEIMCPSTRGVSCAACGLCAGSNKSAKSIVIGAHGGSTVKAARS